MVAVPVLACCEPATTLHSLLVACTCVALQWVCNPCLQASMELLCLAEGYPSVSVLTAYWTALQLAQQAKQMALHSSQPKVFNAC